MACLLLFLRLFWRLDCFALEPSSSPGGARRTRLHPLLKPVVFAAEKDILSKPVWSSVKLVIEEQTITLAAADSFRVVERIAPLPAEASKPRADMLIPARNLSKLADILPSQGPVQILVTPQRNQVVFHLAQGEHIDFVSRLIEGVFPPYKKIIPQGHGTRAVVDTKQLTASPSRSSQRRWPTLTPRRWPSRSPRQGGRWSSNR
jgi:DNA polymerase-3 subunit beta